MWHASTKPPSVDRNSERVCEHPVLQRDSLEELLARDGPVGQRVDGINHQVGLCVVLKLVPVSMTTRPDGLHDHLGAWDLVLNIALKDPRMVQGSTGRSEISVYETKTTTKKLKLKFSTAITVI